MQIYIHIEVIEPDVYPFTGYNSPTMMSKATESKLSTFSRYIILTNIDMPINTYTYINI